MIRSLFLISKINPFKKLQQDVYFLDLDIMTQVHYSFRQLVLVITCLRGGFGINCPREFLKILKLPEQNEDNFKIFKNHEGDLSKKLTKPRM